jgi:Zn-dependent oligopeptidase
MLENWVYNATVLQRISGHYQDLKKPLPDDLREKLVAAKNVNEAVMNRRQLHFGTFDMRIHTTNGPINTAAEWAKTMKEIALFEELPGTNGAASFGHIVGGYSAGYYGYLWAKVYSCDMFDRFKKEGLFNKTVGKSYREHILAPGGTQDSMDGLVAFLGRNRLYLFGNFCRTSAKFRRFLGRHWSPINVKTKQIVSSRKQ